MSSTIYTIEPIGFVRSELKRIEDAIGTGLIAVYHARVRYADGVQAKTA